MGIELVAPQPDRWRARFVKHRAIVAVLLPGAVVSHIGSTAVPGLAAKDVVDILVEVTGEIERAMHVLGDAGYDLEGLRADHAWFSHPNRAARGVVVHVMSHDSDRARDRLDFRDALRAHPGMRAEYLRVKRAAAVTTEDWGVYTAAKAEIVARILADYRRGETRLSW
jgi:GrpB-like predicted nucleotidyltransferase (UPF0157 family)